MIGLDTNVLVRYIVQDDVAQSALATKFIETCSPEDPGFVGVIALIELVWVSESCYSATKMEIIRILRLILGSKQLLVQDSEIVWQALRLFETTEADFADCLAERLAKAAGCSQILTFDKKAARAGMALLK